jgi:membrane protease YdiL (CAAX protease family)
MPTANEATKPRWERAVEAMFRGIWEWGVLYALIAVSLGIALWPLTNVDVLPYIVKNNLTVVQRTQALMAVGLSVLLTTIGYLVVWLRARRREPGLSRLGMGESFRRTNRYAFILLILPLITALGVQKIEVKNGVFTLTLTLTIVALAMLFIHACCRAGWVPTTSRSGRPSTRAGPSRSSSPRCSGTSVSSATTP